MWSGLTSFFYSSPAARDDVNQMNEEDLAAELTVLPAKDAGGWVLVDRPSRSTATAIPPCPSPLPSTVNDPPPPAPPAAIPPVLAPQHRSVPNYSPRPPCLNSLLRGGALSQRGAALHGGSLGGGHSGGGKISRNSAQNVNRAYEVHSACKRQRKYTYDIRNAGPRGKHCSGKRC